MRLRDLDAHFVGGWHDDRATGGTSGWRQLPSIDGAQGLMFQCPKCAVGLERGEELDEVTGEMRAFVLGAHSCLCWFRNPRNALRVPDSAGPGPGRWWVEGTSIDDVSFVQGNPPITNSVLITVGCRWHGFVTNGDASVLSS